MVVIQQRDVFIADHRRDYAREQIAECAEAGQGERRRAAAELADRIAGGQIRGDVAARRSLCALAKMRVHVKPTEPQVKPIAEPEQAIVDITGEAPFGTVLLVIPDRAQSCDIGRRGRSETVRVGEACVSRNRLSWWTEPYKK